MADHDADMAWLNPPDVWRDLAEGGLEAEAQGGTDFWQKTFYGFTRDDGHAFLRPVSGDFSAQLSVEADYTVLYDQAGLMLRAGPGRWIKFGIELTDGVPHLSVVVTDGASDWSARPLALEGAVSLRATRLGGAVLLQHESGSGVWQMARLAPFADDEIGVGPYLCAPERGREDPPFRARFRRFEVTAPRVQDLHAQA